MLIAIQIKFIILSTPLIRVIEIIIINYLGYPDSTPITRVIDGGEPPEFRSLFRKWTDKYQTKSFTYQRKHCEWILWFFFKFTRVIF